MRRLSISLLLVVLLATIGFDWTLDRLFVELQPNDSDRLGPYRVMVEALADSVEQGADIDSLIQAWPSDASAQLSTLDTQQLALPAALRDNLNRGESLTLETDTGISLIVPTDASTQALTLSISSDASKAEAALRVALTLLFYTGIVVLILLWVYPLVTRLHTLSKAAKSFGTGNLGARVPLNRYSLINNIETEFNAMAERIAVLVEDNRLLSSAVSHDLRTPIARLRFGLDALSEEENPKVQAKYLQRISNDLAEMEHLVEVLLDYARLEKQKQALPLQPTSLVPLISDRINAVFIDAANQVQWIPPQQAIWVMANERYLDMAINNVLQNAQRYGNHLIKVSLHADKTSAKRVWLTIEDDGPGIPLEERERVLKPFERGRANIERARPATASVASSSGFGMGLAIVQRIAEWHNAVLTLNTSDDLGGASIGLGFQLCDAADAAASKPALEKS